MSGPLDGGVLGDALLEIERKCTTKASARAVELVRSEVLRARKEEANLLGFFVAVQADVAEEQQRQVEPSE